MAAPGHSTIEARAGADGAPSVDTGNAIGDMTETVITHQQAEACFNTPTFDTIESIFYGGFYYYNSSTGRLTNARLFNRCALKENPIVGPITVGFSGGEDSGKKLYFEGYVGGTKLTELVTCPAAAGFVNTVRTYDAEMPMFVEFVNSAGLTDKPAQRAITLAQTGVTLGVMRGTAANPVGKDLAVRQLYTFLKCTVGAVIDTNYTLDDRKTAPDPGDIVGGEFVQACRWDGLDESVPLPGGELGTLKKICVFGELAIPGSLNTPAYGKFEIAFDLVGNALAS